MKAWLIAILAGGLLAVTIFWAGSQYGGKREQWRAAKAIIELQRREAALVEKLEMADRRRQEDTRDKIRTVEKIVDNCLDCRLPDDVIRLFPRAGDRPAQSGPDARLRPPRPARCQLP